MRWHCLQHVPFEGPAHLASWAGSRGHSLSFTELWTGAALPPLERFDGLFVLGGPMNVYEEDRHPWLAAEKRLLGEAVAAGKVVLGVCLGGQLLSVVLGGEVTRNREREIGWLPVDLLPGARGAGPFRGFPERFTAFHWHGDRFSIPSGATHVARSDACEEQAFVLGDRIVALQFHLETTEESAESLLERCAGEVVPSAHVQPPAAMRGKAVLQRECHEHLEGLLDALAAVRPRS
ncbi:MAG: type 1 glutamine amidotransferase [Planctomycetes bacterium]|nr:type 1 glutamine amidotransferase [Planctomycetota bacterium]